MSYSLKPTFSLLFSFAVERYIALYKSAIIPKLEYMVTTHVDILVDGNRDAKVQMASDCFWLACDLGKTEYVDSVHIYASTVTRRLHTSLTDKLVRFFKHQLLSTKINFQIRKYVLF